MEPRGSPKQMGSTHASDQFPHLRRDVGATETLALPGPVTPEALTMPFQNGLGVDDHDCRFPVRPEPRQDDPEPSVRKSQLGSRNLSFENAQLMAESENLKMQLRSSFQHGWQPMEQTTQECKHAGKQQQI